MEAIGAFAQQIIGLFTGHAVTMMIHIGDRLGLYTTLRDQGAMSAAELGSRTGLQERWLLEWLRDQAAAGIVEHHGFIQWLLREFHRWVQRVNGARHGLPGELLQV